MIVVEDLSRPFPETSLGTHWEVVTDRVMGGVSSAGLSRGTHAGRQALTLVGTVRLDNNGGFVQMAVDLRPDGGARDLSQGAHLVIEAAADGPFELRMRTTDLTRPWQSHRLTLPLSGQWSRARVPLRDAIPHRTELPFDASSVRRLGLVSIGQPGAVALHLSFLAIDVSP